MVLQTTLPLACSFRGPKELSVGFFLRGSCSKAFVLASPPLFLSEPSTRSPTRSSRRGRSEALPRRSRSGKRRRRKRILLFIVLLRAFFAPTTRRCPIGLALLRRRNTTPITVTAAVGSLLVSSIRCSCCHCFWPSQRRRRIFIVVASRDPPAHRISNVALHRKLPHHENRSPK